MARMTPEEVRGFWKQQAIKYGEAPEASWTDVYAMELENRAVTAELMGPNILDAGCANGYKTIEMARAEKFSRFWGVDYIPEMIDAAQKKYDAIKGREILGSIDFSVGNIMNMIFPTASFDCVTVTRVLINLADADAQRAAVKECVRVLRPGGKLVVSEATLEGWENLNQLRLWFDMPVIPMPAFNLYLTDSVFDGCGLEPVKKVDFSSTYFLGTRVLKPLITRLINNGANAADPESEINKLFSKLPAHGDYGIQKMFVFTKR
jgi:ubiquinone/menaquinone biosynthesis C-methylase UbiE